jgi:hypothetical protein
MSHPHSFKAQACGDTGTLQQPFFFAALGARHWFATQIVMHIQPAEQATEYSPG